MYIKILGSKNYYQLTAVFTQIVKSLVKKQSPNMPNHFRAKFLMKKIQIGGRLRNRLMGTNIRVNINTLLS